MGLMTKDLHKKRQKQIRMSDDLRARFDEAVKNSGLPTDQFIEHLLNLADGRNQPSNTELLAILKERLK
jgi:antitoxin component of RelBE/YafQ-DinJ toxin-antitoxin module